MKLRELIIEKVEQIPNGARIIANPGSQQFENILNTNIERFKRGEKNRDEAYVKGLLDRRNNIFWIWDAFDATHNEVEEFLVDAYGSARIDNEAEDSEMVPMLVSDPWYTDEGKILFWARDESIWNHPVVAAATRRSKAQYAQP